MEQLVTRPRTFRTPLGDTVTTQTTTDDTGCFLVESIEIETPLSLVREPRATPDTGRNWERH